ncbi:hypothetical protein [Streptomyces sp. GbtcB7]|nr:hypothetical protein [Streptomyces sp. GbtcB7]
MNVTCRTVMCPAAELTYTVDMYSNAEPPMYRAICGQCKQPITDLVPYST